MTDVHDSLDNQGSTPDSDRENIDYYGDPLVEQRELDLKSRIVLVNSRDVIAVSGEDRLSWLGTLSTQKIDGLMPGQSVEVLFLSVQGRIEYWVHCVDDGTTTWLLIEKVHAEKFVNFLNSMRFALDVKVENRSDEYRVVGATGKAGTLFSRVNSDAQTHQVVQEIQQLLTEAQNVHHVWEDPWFEVQEGGYSYCLVDLDRHPGVGYTWYEYILPRNSYTFQVLSEAEKSGLVAGGDAYKGLRIEAWRPDIQELDEKTLPHELDLISTAVHLNKGCYKGQETVAKVHNVGHPPRRLVFLQVDGSMHSLPREGTSIYDREAFERNDHNLKPIGYVTSSAFHHEMGPIALGVIKRTVDPEADLLVESRYETDSGSAVEKFAASQEIIVSPAAGATAGKFTGQFMKPRRL